MSLDRVTLTGADDSISPEALFSLSQAYPFVEWGILVSGSQSGTPRFPSPVWIAELQAIARKHPYGMRLSLHICGRWVRELLVGDNQGIPLFLTDHFARIQMNFHGETLQWSAQHFAEAIEWIAPRKELIFQIDGGLGQSYLQGYLIDYSNAVPLFDLSSGAGILPAAWPSPFLMVNEGDYAYHGYAGGLGPANLSAEIHRISEAAGEARFWIDMETHIRSDGDTRFDLDKVAQALDIAKPFVLG